MGEKKTQGGKKVMERGSRVTSEEGAVSGLKKDSDERKSTSAGWGGGGLKETMEITCTYNVLGGGGLALRL